MRVVQLSDLHLGPEDHPEPRRRAANATAWTNARRTARRLRERADADELIIVITGDLTDAGHRNPGEFGPVAAWRATLPGRVFCVPGNHDVGNFVAARTATSVSSGYVAQWQAALGPDRFAHAADGHRLLGLNAMLAGSELPEERKQQDWLDAQLAAAAAAGETVHVFQHAPVFLRIPDEVRDDRERYWCPPADARDRLAATLTVGAGGPTAPTVATLATGHVHRRLTHPVPLGTARPVWCPALSGTHSHTDYFPVPRPGEPAPDTHALPEWTLTPAGVAFAWTETGQPVTTRFPR